MGKCPSASQHALAQHDLDQISQDIVRLGRLGRARRLRRRLRHRRGGRGAHGAEQRGVVALAAVRGDRQQRAAHLGYV